MTSDYTIRHAKRYAGRLTLKPNTPRSACERCYTDITEHTPIANPSDHRLWFRCPNCSHTQTRTRTQAHQHAEYCNRSTWTEHS